MQIIKTAAESDEDDVWNCSFSQTVFWNMSVDHISCKILLLSCFFVFDAHISKHLGDMLLPTKFKGGDILKKC